MNFVWFWIPTEDGGEELRLSIKSVQKNFLGDTKITVVGDKPEWYDGHHIYINRIIGCPFTDTKKKIIACSDHPEIDEEFVWIMDDCFMIKPTTIEEMRIPRHDPHSSLKVRIQWHQLIKDTYEVLRKHGKSTLNYATHLPHVFEKTKLRYTFQKYGYKQAMYLFEVLYENDWNEAEYAVPFDRLNFINHPEVAWNSELKRRIEELCE